MKQSSGSPPGPPPSSRPGTAETPEGPGAPAGIRTGGACRAGRREEAPGESERNYRELVQNANSIIMRRDPAGRITFFNEYAQRFFGYAEEEILGKNVLGTIVPEVDSQGRDLARMIRDIGRNPERYANNENENVRRDGQRVWIAWTNKAIPDPDGKVREILCVGNDITERKRLQERLLHSRKMEAVGRLAEGIAHDFNNILTAIIGCSELMLMHLQEGDYLYRKAEQIKKSGERGASLTRRLLEFSRQQVLKPQVMDLNRIVAGQAEMLRRLIGEDIALETRLDATAADVMVDLGAVEQLLIHLCLNAREAMPGGGRLWVFTEDGEAGGRPPGKGHVVLGVRDTGFGMDEETRANLFEPLFTTKGIGHGTGLTLATIYEIVKQCDGDIRVESRPGQGATFRVLFPHAGPAQQAAPSRHAAASAAPNRETVLLVEDEVEVRTLMHEVLGRRGYTVLEARDSRDALDICRQHAGPIHLMVTDVVMPDLCGCDLARRLGPVRPEMQVLYVSGHAREAIEGRRGEGIQGEFLEKPFTADILSATIRKVLDAPSAGRK